MRGISVCVIALLAMAALAAAPGCGGGGSTLSPREQGMQSAYEGSYQVKAAEDGIVQGVGIYDNGSFRLLLEGTPRMVIYNQESGEAWLVNLTMKDYEPITHNEAVSKAGFMPDQVMQPYFDLDQYWNGPEFRMDTADGRSVKAYLEGPGYLPSRWEAESRGEVFKEVTWEYRRVGRVSPDNFRLPEGLSPKS